MSKMDADKAYANAQDLMKRGDYGQAKMMLTIALHKDPENEQLKAALEDAKAKAAAAPAQKSAAPAPMLDLGQALSRAPSGMGGARVEEEHAAPAEIGLLWHNSLEGLLDAELPPDPGKATAIAAVIADALDGKARLGEQLGG